MSELRYTLLADGPSDRRLSPLLTWLLRQHLPTYALQPQWADLRRFPKRPTSLEERIGAALDLFPCELLFIHRDAEKEAPQVREEQIRLAVAGVKACANIPIVSVVPVRMQESWLGFDESAIRRAVGNPNGKDSICLPALKDMEGLLDPKETIYQCMRNASGKSGRRRKGVKVAELAYRVADEIESFAPLRALPSFQRLESGIIEVIQEQGW